MVTPRPQEIITKLKKFKPTKPKITPISSELNNQTITPISSELNNQTITPISSELNNQTITPISSELNNQTITPIISELDKQMITPISSELNKQMIKPTPALRKAILDLGRTFASHSATPPAVRADLIAKSVCF